MSTRPYHEPDYYSFNINGIKIQLRDIFFVTKLPYHNAEIISKVLRSWTNEDASDEEILRDLLAAKSNLDDLIEKVKVSIDVHNKPINIVNYTEARN